MVFSVFLNIWFEFFFSNISKIETIDEGQHFRNRRTQKQNDKFKLVCTEYYITVEQLIKLTFEIKYI